MRLSSSENTIDGVTNDKGEMILHNILADEFLTIYAEKPGFYNAQRTYINDNNQYIRLEEQGLIVKQESETRLIYIILVREQVVKNEGLITIISYCNLFGKNFQPVMDFSEEGL